MEGEMPKELLYGLIVASCLDDTREDPETMPEWMDEPCMRETLRNIYNFLIDGEA